MCLCALKNNRRLPWHHQDLHTYRHHPSCLPGHCHAGVSSPSGCTSSLTRVLHDMPDNNAENVDQTTASEDSLIMDEVESILNLNY